MPKSIIREYENPNRTLDLSANFAVFVPGLASINDEKLVKEATKAGIYYADTNIYKLSTTSQFDKYIGTCELSDEVVLPTSAIPEKVNPASSSETADSYIYHISSFEAGKFNENEYKYYKIVAGPTTVKPSDWATKRKLWVELKTKASETSSEIVSTYYKLEWYKKSEMQEDIESAEPSEPFDITAIDLLKIKVGNEGTDVSDEERHLGNKIARELLDVGYTVYYKVLKTQTVEEGEDPDPTKTVLAQLLDKDLWAPLKDKSTYRIRYITSGGCYNYNVYKLMADIVNFNNDVKLEDADTLINATGRGDCIALLDINEDNLKSKTLNTPETLAKAFGDEATDIKEKIGDAGKYCAIFAPRVIYKGASDDFDIKYPASFNYLLCAARAHENYAEWWAVAGYTRGISYKTIESTTYNFGDLLVNTLAPRVKNSYTDTAINLILNERGNYYLWGNRTAYPIGETDNLMFSHFLNVRQLCTTLKQVIYNATRQFTFDPNSDILWINFVNAIRPTLERMKGDQGIAGYKISKIATDKKAVLMAKIRIVPIEAVEDFDISVYLENSIDGIIVDANETVAD